MCEVEDYAEMFETKTVKLRKKANCCECGQLLTPGTQCTVYSGLYDGAWFYDRECSDCTRLRRAWGDSEPIGGLLECIRESVAGSGISRPGPLAEAWIKLKEAMLPEKWAQLVAIDKSYIDRYHKYHIGTLPL